MLQLSIFLKKRVIANHLEVAGEMTIHLPPHHSLSQYLDLVQREELITRIRASRKVCKKRVMVAGPWRTDHIWVDQANKNGLTGMWAPRCSGTRGVVWKVICPERYIKGNINSTLYFKIILLCKFLGSWCMVLCIVHCGGKRV